MNILIGNHILMHLLLDQQSSWTIIKNQIPYVPKQGSQNQKSWYTFFCAPDMFMYTIVYLTFHPPQQSFVHTCMLTFISWCIDCKKKRNILEQKVKLRSIPLTTNPRSSLGIHIAFYISKTCYACKTFFYLQFTINFFQVSFLNSVNKVIFYDNLLNFLKQTSQFILGAPFSVYLVDVLAAQAKLMSPGRDKTRVCGYIHSEFIH